MNFLQRNQTGILITCMVLSAFGAIGYHESKQNRTIEIRAGIIRGSGDVYPAARDEIIFSPYSLKEIQAELKSLNKMGLPPKPPKKEDSKFNPKSQISEKPEEPDSVYSNFEYNYPRPDSDDDRFKTRCVYFEFMESTECMTDYDAYSSAVDAWSQARDAAYNQAQARVKAYEQQVEQWENAKVKAYQQAYQKYQAEYDAWVEKGEQHLDQVLAKKLETETFYRVKTDLDGKAKLKIKPGKWFVSGGNATNLNSIFWNEVPFEVTEKTESFELANDVGEVENNSFDASEETPKIADLMYGHSKTTKVVENELADLDYIKKYLAQSRLTEIKNLDGWTLLHIVAAAAPIPKRAELTHLLLLYGSDMNLPDKDGKTPLHLSVENNNRATTMFLLAYGANPNLADHEARSPLHLAVQKDLPHMIPLLLRYGASLKQVNGKGQTPFEMAKVLKRTRLLPMLQIQADGSLPQTMPSQPAKPTKQPVKGAKPKASAKPGAKPTDKPSASAGASTAPSSQSSAAASASPAL